MRGTRRKSPWVMAKITVSNCLKIRKEEESRLASVVWFGLSYQLNVPSNYRFFPPSLNLRYFNKKYHKLPWGSYTFFKIQNLTS